MLSDQDLDFPRDNHQVDRLFPFTKWSEMANILGFVFEWFCLPCQFFILKTKTKQMNIVIHPQSILISAPITFDSNDWLNRQVFEHGKSFLEIWDIWKWHDQWNQIEFEMRSCLMQLYSLQRWCRNLKWRLGYLVYWP